MRLGLTRLLILAASVTSARCGDSAATNVEVDQASDNPQNVSDAAAVRDPRFDATCMLPCPDASIPSDDNPGPVDAGPVPVDTGPVMAATTPDAYVPPPNGPVAGGTANSGTWTGAFTSCISSSDYVCKGHPLPTTYTFSKNGFLLSNGIELTTPGQTFVDTAFGFSTWRLLQIRPGGDRVTMGFERYSESSTGSTLSQGQTTRVYYFMLVGDGETWEQALARGTNLTTASRAHMQIREDSRFTLSGGGLSSTTEDITFYNADLRRP